MINDYSLKSIIIIIDNNIPSVTETRASVEVRCNAFFQHAAVVKGELLNKPKLTTPLQMLCFGKCGKKRWRCGYVWLRWEAQRHKKKSVLSWCSFAWRSTNTKWGQSLLEVFRASLTWRKPQGIPCSCKISCIQQLDCEHWGIPRYRSYLYNRDLN